MCILGLSAPRILREHRRGRAEGGFRRRVGSTATPSTLSGCLVCSVFSHRTRGVEQILLRAQCVSFLQFELKIIH
jgi:hypothetical protein